MNSPDDGTVDAIAETMHTAEITAAQQRADVVGAFYAQLMQWDDMDEDVALNLTVWEYWSSSGFSDY